MYFYLKGKVALIEKDSIVLDVNNIGYLISVKDINEYKENDNLTLYIYDFIKDDDEVLYGFKTIEEKELFTLLLKVNGIGPKTSMMIIKNATIFELKEAINNGDINFLKKIPGVGKKCAAQIILDLKNDNNILEYTNNPMYEELFSILKSMGYKSSEIKFVLNDLKFDGDKIENLIKISLNKLKNLKVQINV